jgi:Flp pilus assembly protein TadB
VNSLQNFCASDGLSFSSESRQVSCVHWPGAEVVVVAGFDVVVVTLVVVVVVVVVVVTAGFDVVVETFTVVVVVGLGRHAHAELAAAGLLHGL